MLYPVELQVHELDFFRLTRLVVFLPLPCTTPASPPVPLGIGGLLEQAAANAGPPVLGHPTSFLHATAPAETVKTPKDPRLADCTATVRPRWRRPAPLAVRFLFLGRQALQPVSGCEPDPVRRPPVRLPSSSPLCRPAAVPTCGPVDTPSRGWGPCGRGRRAPPGRPAGVAPRWLPWAGGPG